MRLDHTPESWRPTRPVIRHRSFDRRGYPTFTVGFGCVSFVGSALAWAQVLHRMSFGIARVEMPVLVIAVASLLVGLACAYFAARRLLTGHDGAIELDPVARTMLVLSAGAAPAIVPFADITALAVQSADRHYTSGRQTRQTALVALPNGTVLLEASGDNMISRERAVGRLRAIATQIAPVLGVPVV